MAFAKALRIIERFLLYLGISALSVYVGVRVHGILSSRGALERFRTLEQPRPHLGGSPVQKFSLPQPDELDFSLWSEKRIAGYREALSQYFAPPLAVVRIPKVHIVVPLFDGTDELTLNRGVGRIVGTAKPGQMGNIGVAGHRDGFFRGLKDIGPGDTVELEMPNRTDRYVVDNIQITSPEDVSVLQPAARPSLTLVTCYPFYFIGSAPQRYIVHASATDLDRFSSNPAYQTQSEVTTIIKKEEVK